MPSTGSGTLTMHLMLGLDFRNPIHTRWGLKVLPDIICICVKYTQIKRMHLRSPATTLKVNSM
jgi:hypothetical protein